MLLTMMLSRQPFCLNDRNAFEGDLRELIGEHYVDTFTAGLTRIFKTHRKIHAFYRHPDDCRYGVGKRAFVFPQNT